MKDTAYSRFRKDTKHDLILRDELAIDRTLLANERTLLAYLRAAVALVIAGITIMHFAQDDGFFIVGVVCIPAGILTGGVGIVSFRRMKRAIEDSER